MGRCKLFLLVASVFALAVDAADWPAWRGPDRDGISQESGLLRNWPADGPPIVWKASGLGEGFSSVAVADGRIFTLGQREGEQYLIALEEQSGKKLWEASNGSAYRNRRGHGPRGTPTVDGQRVYALGSDGTLLAAEAATGKRLWGLNLLRRFNARNISWGLSESPLIDGNQLIVNAGGNGASIVALDKSSGDLLWRSQSDEAGYSSAVVSKVGGVRQYILLTGEAAVGVRADNGELLWRYTQVSNSTANVATPIVRDNYVFVSSDYGTGCALLKLTSTGGGVKSEEIYFNRNMRNHYSSSVLVGDYLYGYSSRILTCMEFATGEVVWRDRSVGKGQAAYADGLLFLLSEDGVVGLAKATPEGYRELSRFEIGRGQFPTWTQPVVANGKLYLRDQDTLYCYNVGGS